MEILKTITEGGQIWAHRVRMAKQVLKIASCVSLVISAVFFCYRLTKIPSFHYQAAFYYLNAKILSLPEDTVIVSGKFWGRMNRQHITQNHLSLKATTVAKACEKHASSVGNQISNNIDLTAKQGSYAFLASIIFFLFRGLRSRKKQHIEGKKIISNRKLALKLILSGQTSPIKFGSIPLVKGTETQHILISGATGSGKTNAYHTLLPQIRKLRQRALIVDITGEFVEKYYRPDKDVLINPFDRRSVSWHPWCECSEDADFKAMAQSFIPSSYKDDDNFWRDGAQEIFYAALKETSFRTKTSTLSKLLLYDSLATLSTFLKGTSAASYLDLSSEKTSGSFRAVAATFLKSLEFLPDTENPFSIRRWVTEEKPDSWLFLCCTPKHRASITSLLSAWLSIGISSLLQLKPDHHRRLWVAIDELPKLNRLKPLESFLTESRKFGGCGLLAIQSPAQLESIYGREMTSTLIGNCATRIAFAEYDAMIAERISKSFGNKEIRESQEALSYGAHEMRDGVNLSYQTKTSAVVSPTALQSLDTMEAFVKLPGTRPVSKIKLKLQNIPKIAESFISN